MVGIVPKLLMFLLAATPWTKASDVLVVNAALRSPIVVDVLPDAVLTKAEAALNSVVRSFFEMLGPTRLTVALGNMSIGVDHQTTISLTNVTMVISDPVRISNVSCDLKLRSLQLQYNLGSILFSATFVVHNDSAEELVPVVSEGTVNVTLQNVTASAMVGFVIVDGVLLFHGQDVIFDSEASRQMAWTSDGSDVPEVEAANWKAPLLEQASRTLTRRLNTLLENVVEGLPFEVLFETETEANLFRTAAREAEDEFNNIIDGILESANAAILRLKHDVIQLPNLNRTFSEGVGYLKISGHVEAWDGKFASLASLQRTSRFVAGHHGGRYWISGGVGLARIHLAYRHYHASLMNIGPSGNLQATIGNNSVLFRVSGGYNKGRCSLNLESISLNELDNIHVNLDGLGPFNEFASLITSWVTNALSDTIANVVNGILAPHVQDALEAFDCTGLLPPHVE